MGVFEKVANYEDIMAEHEKIKGYRLNKEIFKMFMDCSVEMNELEFF